MTATPTQTKVYYSRSPHLYLVLDIGKQIIMEGGSLGRIGEKFAQFTPVGDGKHGKFLSSDPEIIELMDRQLASGRDDLLTEEQFMETSTPDHIKIDNLRRANEASERKIEELNKLIQDLKAGKVGSKA